MEHFTFLVLTVSGDAVRAMAYNPTDDLLYAIYSPTSTTTNDYLYSIDPLTLDVTFIGDTGLPDIQGAELNSDDTYTFIHSQQD